MAKRILIFSLNYYPFVGGAEVAIKEITDRVEDIEFHLIAYRFDSALPKEERIGNVIVHRVGIGKRDITARQIFHPIAYLAKILYVPLAVLAAWRLIRALRFDAFWAMMSYMLFPIVLLRFVGVRRPYVLTLQEGDPFEHVFERRHIRAVAPLLRYGFRHADAVQAISTFLLSWAREAGFSGEGEVIPNGVDTERFAHAYEKADIAAMREGLGKQKNDLFLVTTSRLVHKNAVDTVIRALPLLPEHVSFLIYGSGPDEAMLRELAVTLGVSERVRFMGQATHAELPLILSACDVFVRPSRSEGMGNSFIEAMAAGLPVIATQEGGISDFLFDAKRNPDKPTTGWAVDVDSPAQIAAAVVDIVEHPEQAQAVVKTARKMAVEQYDWGLVAKRMSALFEQVSSIETIGRRPSVLFAAGPRTERGGPAEYVRGIGRELSRRSYRVRAVHFNASLFPGLSHALYLLRLIGPALRARSIIAIDTWSVGIPAFIAAKLTGRAFIIRVGGDFLWEHYVQRTGQEIPLSRFYTTDVALSRKERFIYAGTRFMLSHTDCIAFNTEWQADIWKKPYSLGSNVHVIENRYPPYSPQTERTKVFVCAGRATKIKNLKRVKEAFAAVRDRHPEFTLDLRTLPEKEHEIRLRSCYALIQGSISDIAPNAVIKAAAYGTPFICTADTGIQDRLEGRGLFVDTLDRKALEQAIEQLMDPQTHDRFSDAPTWVERDWNRVTDDFETILRST